MPLFQIVDKKQWYVNYSHYFVKFLLGNCNDNFIKCSWSYIKSLEQLGNSIIFSNTLCYTVTHSMIF